MRYRNRIKLAPGLNINLSKSGISATLGTKGASVNFGKNGAYLNSGIPGTGLYNRTKISSNQQTISKSTSVSNNQTQVGIKIDLNENYEPIIEIFDNKGVNITNPTLVNRVKKTEEYKYNIKILYKKYCDLINEKTLEFTEIHKHIIKPVSVDEIEKKLSSLKIKTYTREVFSKEKPNEDLIREELKNKAKQDIKSILFWKNSGLRNQFVEDNIDLELKKSIEKWEKEKILFEEMEDELEVENNKNLQDFFENEKMNLVNNLNGNEEFVLKNFETILNEIKIEPEFHIDFEYDEEEKIFYIDLDLPEIEDIPKEIATILGSGKISVKNKTDKLLKEDYAKCVSSIALLIAGITFMSSVGIKFVNISAYTQRLNKQDGNVNDDYIFTVEFEREKFSSLNYKNIDPIESFKNFNNKMNLSNSFEFKKIDI